MRPIHGDSHWGESRYSRVSQVHLKTSDSTSHGAGKVAEEGDAIIVRYADGFVVGFQYRQDAERVLRALKGRLGRFGLELHPFKTWLIEFSRFAKVNRAVR